MPVAVSAIFPHVEILLLYKMIAVSPVFAHCVAACGALQNDCAGPGQGAGLFMCTTEFVRQYVITQAILKAHNPSDLFESFEQPLLLPCRRC
jgi:hypothetical protein